MGDLYIVNYCSLLWSKTVEKKQIAPHIVSLCQPSCCQPYEEDNSLLKKASLPVQIVVSYGVDNACQVNAVFHWHQVVIYHIVKCYNHCNNCLTGTVRLGAREVKTIAFSRI